MAFGGTDRPSLTGQGQTEDRDRAARGELRVILLCHAPAGWRWEVPGVQWIVADSPYEAAAEILCAPTAGIVVDLAILSKGHKKLLDVARGMGTEVLAVGAIPGGLTSEDLSGVRLISKADLNDALHRLRERELSGGPPAPEIPDPDVTHQEHVPETPLHDRGSAGGDENAPSPGVLEAKALQELMKEAPISALQAGNEDPPSEGSEGEELRQRPSSPSGLLSDAELSALLEDEP